MKIASKPKFYVGIIIAAILIISYFIKINIDTGSNYETTDSILGIIIFHNLIILLIYIAIAVILTAIGIKKIQFI